MKKIPTLFERIYENHKVVGIKNKLTDPSLQVVLDGKCIPTIQLDGSCCAIINGTLYKRYVAKPGEKLPKGAIPCSPPDPITGHQPYWVLVDENNPSDKWFIKAKSDSLVDGTYEAIGPHFRENPYELIRDILYKHGVAVITDLKKFSFKAIKRYLKQNYIEGIVFWYEGEPLCKIKRSDFGFGWGKK